MVVTVLIYKMMKYKGANNKVLCLTRYLWLSLIDLQWLYLVPDLMTAVLNDKLLDGSVQFPVFTPY